MKNPRLTLQSVARARSSLALAFLVGSLSAVSVSAQSSSSGTTGSSGTTRSSSAGAGSTSGSGQSSNTSATADPTRSTDNQMSLKRTDRRFLTKAVEGSQKEVAISQLAAQRATSAEVKSFAQQLVSDHQKMNAELMQLAQRKGVSLDELGLSSSSMSSTGGAGSAGSASSSEPSTNAGIASDNGAPRATGAAGTAGTPASTGIATNAATATSGPDAHRSMSSASDLSADLTSDRHYRNLVRRTGADFDREYVDQMVDHHETDVQLFQKASKSAQDSDIRSFASNQLSKLQAHLDRANSLMKSAAE